MKDELQVTYVNMLEAEQFAQDRIRKESDELYKAKAVLLHEQRHAKDKRFATSAEFSGGAQSLLAQRFEAELPFEKKNKYFRHPKAEASHPKSLGKSKF